MNLFDLLRYGSSEGDWDKRYDGVKLGENVTGELLEYDIVWKGTMLDFDGISEVECVLDVLYDCVKIWDSWW